MPDGMTYAVSWRHTSKGWEFWLRDRTRIRGAGRDQAGAERALNKAISRTVGDGEPVLTFDPPLPGPASDRQYLADGLMCISGSGYTDLLQKGREKLYGGPPCNHCGHPTGPRVAGQIHLASSMTEDVGSPSGLWSFFADPILVSERFLSLLTTAELRCLEWRECVRLPNTRKRVFEAIPKSFVRTAAPKGIPVEGGWRCPLCRRTAYHLDAEKTHILTFADRRKLPRPLPPFFAVGDFARYELVTTATRALELLARKESRGMRALPLGVLDVENVNTRLELRDRPRND